MLVSDVAGCPISFEGVSFQFWDSNNSEHVKIWQFTHSVGERHTWVDGWARGLESEEWTRFVVVCRPFPSSIPITIMEYFLPCGQSQF